MSDGPRIDGRYATLGATARRYARAVERLERERTLEAAQAWDAARRALCQAAVAFGEQKR